MPTAPVAFLLLWADLTNPGCRNPAPAQFRYFYLSFFTCPALVLKACCLVITIDSFTKTITMNTIPPGANGLLFCVSTSHMDWDWVMTFDEYYTYGNGNTNPASGNGTPAVRYILDEAISLIQQTLNDDPPYKYNLAEVGWMKRYLQDNPGLPPDLAKLLGYFSFMGGGITSPDNLVCNGEAFIRNYLFGQNFLKRLNLGHLISNVCWIPDDFGQDEQLPVVLTAMGMKGVSFSRVPGNEPNYSHNPAQDYYPTNPDIPSVNAELLEQGVNFNWRAADGSQILAAFLWDGYGIIWNQATSTSQAQTLTSFVQQQYQPGNLYLAPCGGDFSPPSLNLTAAVSQYNNGSNYYGATGVAAVMGSFGDFIDALKAWEAQNPNGLRSRSMDASTYWTGYFASRVQLKINQQKAVLNLQAAETLSTLLRCLSGFSDPVAAGIDTAVGAAWDNLLPSTHHDFVTGTSPDNVYYTEQLPLSELALNQSLGAVRAAINRLGEAVHATPGAGEYPFVVFNPGGFSRSQGRLIEIPGKPEYAAVVSFRQSGQTGLQPVQRSADGNILLPFMGLGSMSYACLYLSETEAPILPPVATCPNVTGPFVMSNGLVQIRLNQDAGWAIDTLNEIGEEGCVPLLEPGQYANQIKLAYETYYKSSGDLGNLYQMGNELAPRSNNPDGFWMDGSSAFAGKPINSEMRIGGKPMGIVETGPYRWHFRGEAYNEANDVTVTVEYILEYMEPMVRMRVTGAAPEVASSVITSWTCVDKSGRPASGFCFGSGNHWNGPNYIPYWQGPAFRPTHDYLTVMPTAQDKYDTLGAVYHLGMRSWAYYGNQLMGILFRNPPAGGRGASGSDLGVHEQNYAFRIPSGLNGPQSCQPLQESLAFQQRQLWAPVVVAPAYPLFGTGLNTLSETGTLAVLNQPNGLIRLARLQPGSGGSPANTGLGTEPLPFSFVLRIYQPTNSRNQTWSVDIPFLRQVSFAGQQVSLVTALEEELPGEEQNVTCSNGTITLPDMPSLATVRVSTATG